MADPHFANTLYSKPVNQNSDNSSLFSQANDYVFLNQTSEPSTFTSNQENSNSKSPACKNRLLELIHPKATEDQIKMALDKSDGNELHAAEFLKELSNQQDLNKWQLDNQMKLKNQESSAQFHRQSIQGHSHQQN